MSKTNAQQEISEEQLNGILSQVNSELEVMFKNERPNLVKARPGEETPGEGSDKDDSSATDPSGDNTSDSGPPADATGSPTDASASDSAPPADDASAASADPGAAPPADGSAPADPAAEAGPIDPQQLMAEYAQLPPEDLKAHYLACKEALIQVLGAPSGGPDASAPADTSSATPPAPPPPDAASAAPAPPPPAADASAGAPPPPAGPPADDSAGPTLKAEKGMAGQKPGESATKAPDGMKDDPKANGENPLHKAELDALKVKVDEVNAVSGALLAIVKKVVEKPLRKSVQFLADVTPAATAPDVTKMSRDQIRAKLKVVASSATLKKSDRDLITGYDLNTVKADQIAHLLK